MLPTVKLPLFAALGLSAALFAASPAVAEMVKFSAMLDATREVPTNDSAGTGMVEATFDTDSKMLDWTIEYSDLTGTPTAAHFHGPAAAGENAPPMVPLSGDLASPIKGSATLTDEQAAALTEGKVYFNLHTAAHKDGEIRGQLEQGDM
jgi:hypothetical protein